MTISKREQGYTENSLKIGIGLGAGMTREDAAAFAGVSAQTVYNLKDREFTRMVEGLVKTAIAQSRAQQAEVTKENIDKEVWKRVDKALKAWDRGLENPDVEIAMKAGDRYIDRAMGKATQRTENTTHITERRVIELPMSVVQLFQSAVQPKAIEGEVIDADPIDA